MVTTPETGATMTPTTAPTTTHPGHAGPIGVMDVGGGHATAALVDPARPDLVTAEHATDLDPHADTTTLLDALAGAARASAAEASTGTPPADWAIAMPGPFDAEAGRGTFAGVDKFAALAGVDLRTALADRIGVAPAAVRFVNDAVSYGIGEWATGAGDREARMVCITLGTGVGSAFLDDGREVDSGDTVPESGDAHRLTFDGRPLEETISSPAIRDRFRDRTGSHRSVAEVCAAARAGDGDAVAVIDTAMRALGVALAPWLVRFEATRLVVGGSIARSWDVIGAPIRAGLDEVVPGLVGSGDDPGVLTVLPGTLGGTAPLVGAAVWWDRR
jgi:glucokinase